MQTSGTFPQLSDGVKKQVAVVVPKVVAAPTVPAVAMPRAPRVPSVSTHRSGGYHRQQRVK